MDAIPVIDMTPARTGDPAGRAIVAAALADACARIGFFALVGHGIADHQVADTQRTARAFFEQGAEPKVSVLRRPPEFNRGWIPPESESLGATLGAAAPNDLKESFTMGPPDVPATEYYTRPEAFPHFARNRWPEQPADLRPVLTAYFTAVEALATDLMRLFALGLGLPERWFDPSIDRQCGSLRALFYPPQQGVPAPGQLRAGAHTDYGCITILKTEEAPGGLEVAVPGTDRWIPVPTIPGAFVVNLGDLMRHWTNDRWASTLHRVVNPPAAAEGTDRGRLSLAFFHQPNYDALIDCVPTCVDATHPKRYDPVTSGGHRLRKLFKANAFEAAPTG